MANDPSWMTQARLQGQVHYDPATGFFERKVASGNVNAGSRVLNTNGKGYVRFSLFGTRFVAARLAWLYVYGEWPQGTIDHINRDKSDNRIANLRLASCSEQQCNRGKQSNNTTGVVGVSCDQNRVVKKLSPWHAYIDVKGQRKHLGYYATLEEAKVKRQQAEQRFHGNFARTYHEVIPMHTTTFVGTEAL